MKSGGKSECAKICVIYFTKKDRECSFCKDRAKEIKVGLVERQMKKEREGELMHAQRVFQNETKTHA